MEVKIVHNRNEVFDFLKERNRFNYIYQFNNTDLREWKNTICYGGYEEGVLKEIALVYHGCHIPVLIAAGFEENKYNRELIKEIKAFLPKKFYTHINKDILQETFCDNKITDYHEYVNMGINDFSKIDRMKKDNTAVLSVGEVDKIRKLFQESYPDNWMDEAHLEFTNCYGVEKEDKIISFAGIHAYSRERQVASIAHVTTHPDYRGLGYAKECIAGVINDMKDKIEYIGLNVKKDNVSAIKCYESLGFKRYGEFVACDIEL